MEIFRCERQGATLTTRGCAHMWEAARAEPPKPWDSRAKCVGCALGAVHAGHDEAEAHRQEAARALEGVCPRCERRDFRLIKAAGLCVSCYNRQREVRVGRNASGGQPRKLPATLQAIELLVMVPEKPVRIVRVADTTLRAEAMLRLARAADGVPIAFAAWPPAELPLSGPDMPPPRRYLHWSSHETANGSAISSLHKLRCSALSAEGAPPAEADEATQSAFP